VIGRRRQYITGGRADSFTSSALGASALPPKSTKRVLGVSRRIP